MVEEAKAAKRWHVVSSLQPLSTHAAACRAGDGGAEVVEAVQGTFSRFIKVEKAKVHRHLVRDALR